MLGEMLGETSLVAVSIDGFNSWFSSSTALPGGDDGVPHASVRQPAWTAVVQSVVPGGVELRGGSQLRSVTHTVRLGLPEGETLGGGARKHLAFTEKVH